MLKIAGNGNFHFFLEIAFSKLASSKFDHAADIVLTLCLLMQIADSLCKQFGLRSGSTSKLFDTLMVVLKEFFRKIDFEKNQRTTKKLAKLPSR